MDDACIDRTNSFFAFFLEHEMSHRLDVEKTIQAVGVLLRKEGKRASRLRILKLLYIADRVMLETTGSLMLGSKIVAMKHGPLHSELLDLIKGQHIAEPSWSRHFRNIGKDVVLEGDEPDIGRLSKHEISLLNEVVDARINKDDWHVADETHEFEEWRKNYPNRDESTSRPIPIADIIEATGRGDDKNSILQDMKDSESFDTFFAGIAR
jgi:uncharacterized phage-associated protein